MLAWGNFLTVAVNFLIIAFVLFVVVRGINILRKSVTLETEEAPPPQKPHQEIVLEEIRDLLAQIAQERAAPYPQSNPPN